MGSLIEGSLPTERLHALAADIRAGLVFGTWNIEPEDFHRMYAVIFFGLTQEGVEVPDNAGAVYEYRDRAERQVEGYPVFFTQQFLNVEDATALRDLLIQPSQGE